MKKTIEIIVLALLCLKSRTNLYASITAFSLLTLMTVLTASRVQGQETKQAGGITIGQQVPDVLIKTILNYNTTDGPATSAKVSDFRGKLLIIDFWATWCTSCIYKFPELDQLQDEFAGLGNVYQQLFRQSLDNLDELAMVITSSKLRMSDDERLQAIDRIFADTQDKLMFLRSFNKEASILSLQRQKEKADLKSTRQYYNLN